MNLQSSDTKRRVLSRAEVETLLTMRKPRTTRQTPGEWAREHGRAGVVTLWSVYDGSMRLWWAHAKGEPAKQSLLLGIARDWWWDKGGAVSRLTTSPHEWERALARVLVRELDPLFGGWDGIVFREGHRLVAWLEGPGVVVASPAAPIMGPEERPPHGTHVRGALGCNCLACELALQATRQMKREPGRPRKRA